MRFQEFNKATAAALSGAIVTILGSILILDQEVAGALQTLLATALVYFVSNR